MRSSISLSVVFTYLSMSSHTSLLTWQEFIAENKIGLIADTKIDIILKNNYYIIY
jgi:hypothetical protein